MPNDALQRTHSRVAGIVPCALGQTKAMRLKHRRARGKRAKTHARVRFNAEAAYAQSIFQSALGDQSGSVSALQRSLALNPGFAPAIFSLGSVEYQRGRKAQGRELFHSLLALPKSTPDLCDIIDEAGDFLIERREYRDVSSSITLLPLGFPELLHSTRVSGAVLDTEVCTTRRSPRQPEP